MITTETGRFRCAYCGENNEIVVDRSGGWNQQYVEDCAVCCRPNVLRIRIDSEASSLSIESDRES
jgi:hypothetical protein